MVPGVRFQTPVMSSAGLKATVDTEEDLSRVSHTPLANVHLWRILTDFGGSRPLHTANCLGPLRCDATKSICHSMG
jgi:hypothetical protein